MDSHKYYFANGANAWQVKDSPGILRKIIVGVTEANSTIDVYDSASANANQVLALAGNMTGLFELNAAMSYGIRMVVANASKVTVLYE